MSMSEDYNFSGTAPNSEPVRLVGDDSGVVSYDGDFETILGVEVQDGELKLVKETRPTPTWAKRKTEPIHPAAEPNGPCKIRLKPCTPEANEEVLKEDARLHKTRTVVDHPKMDTAQMMEVMNKWDAVCKTSPYPELQGICEYLSNKLGEGIAIDFDDKGRMSIRTNLYANQVRLMGRSLRAAFPDGVDEAMGDLILKNFKGLMAGK